MAKKLRVGFLGAGKMATALGRGFMAAGAVRSADLVASDVHAASRESFAKATGARAIPSNVDVVRNSDVIFIAVKPQVVASVLSEVASVADSRQLFISIAAGIPLSRLHQLLGAEQRIVRVMPNTPALVGAGASAYAIGPAANRDDAVLVEKMLGTVGIAVEVPEHLLDAVTGLSGSGPAYVFQIIEALSDGGVRVGLPRQVATQLAAQTLLGAARMVLETGEHPGALKDSVTSPGGTTIAGIHELERGGLRGLLMDAVQAATQRSQELAGN